MDIWTVHVNGVVKAENQSENRFDILETTLKLFTRTWQPKFIWVNLAWYIWSGLYNWKNMTQRPQRACTADRRLDQPTVFVFLKKS